MGDVNWKQYLWVYVLRRISFTVKSASLYLAWKDIWWCTNHSPGTKICNIYNHVTLQSCNIYNHVTLQSCDIYNHMTLQSVPQGLQGCCCEDTVEKKVSIQTMLKDQEMAVICEDLSIYLSMHDVSSIHHSVSGA